MMPMSTLHGVKGQFLSIQAVPFSTRFAMQKKGLFRSNAANKKEYLRQPPRIDAACRFQTAGTRKRRCKRSGLTKGK